MRRTFLFRALVLATTLAVAAPVRADPPPQPAPSPTWRTTGTWGWAVVGAGLAAGAGLTMYGLTFDCSESDRACQRGASVAIWGGIGLAMLSTAVGIAIVQNGRRRVQLAPVVSAFGEPPRGGFVLRATF